MSKQPTLSALFLRFLHFGMMAWGGPVAQISMIREELVGKEKWITSQKFNRALSVYQALPGPEAHEMCVYIGMEKAGRLGGFIAGLGFMLPGFLLMLAASYIYLAHGSTSLLPFFIGMTPAVSALIVRAVHRIGGHILISRGHWIAAIAAFMLTSIGSHFLYVLILCGAFLMAWQKDSLLPAYMLLSLGSALACIFSFFSLFIPDVSSTLSFNPSSLSLLYDGLKAGLLSFGGAYTALPFLKENMVGFYSAIDDQVFTDAIAITSILPAPLLIIGTFLGYMADGLEGALIVTFGIFAPAFLFTLLGHNAIERVINNTKLHSFLDGISAGVIGLFAYTALTLLTGTLQNTTSFCLFAVALVGFYLTNSKYATPCIMLFFAVIGRLFSSNLS